MHVDVDSLKRVYAEFEQDLAVTKLTRVHSKVIVDLQTDVTAHCVDADLPACHRVTLVNIWPTETLNNVSLLFFMHVKPFRSSILRFVPVFS